MDAAAEDLHRCNYNRVMLGNPNRTGSLTGRQQLGDPNIGRKDGLTQDVGWTDGRCREVRRTGTEDSAGRNCLSTAGVRTAETFCPQL